MRRLLIGGILAATVVGTVAILAFPTIKSRYREAQIRSNEASAIGLLRYLCARESEWRSMNPDGNRFPDYWTNDLWGMYACVDEAGVPVKIIDLPLGSADRFPRRNAPVGPPRPYYAEIPSVRPTALSGYLFEVLVLDENGQGYAPLKPDDCNWNRFGFRALPEVYGISGVHIFQVNQEGCIYRRDAGHGAESKPPQGNWEGGKDPTSVKPPWQVVE